MLDALRRLEKWAYRKSDSIIVIAKEFTDFLVKEGVNPTKIIRIPNWADTEVIRPLPKESNEFRKSHLLADKFVVLYAGNIGLTEGLETVIEAAVCLVHIPDIRFVIVGDRTAIEKLKVLADARHANNVILLPFQPRETLAEMLSAANAGLVMQKHNVTNYNSPSKIPLLLAAGLPVIASVPAVTPAYAAVDESQAGVFVKPENPEVLAKAIVDLYNDPARQAELGRRARQFALDHYSMDRALTDYESALRAVVNKRSQNLITRSQEGETNEREK